MSITNLITITPKAEEIIAYCARVSNPSNQDNPESEKLIRYLIKHRHWSPFEMAHMVVEINTTRAIAAQILRHRSFSFQEFSQRYADIDFLSGLEVPDLRRQDTKNRQNSIDDLDPGVVSYYQRQIDAHFDNALDLYRDLVDSGVAKECARGVLPLNTPSRLYMAGSVRSWLHYVDLRSANGTQKEHMEIALGVKEIIRTELPNIFSAFFTDG
jgi:thymidylate synthase (FAD)